MSSETMPNPTEWMQFYNPNNFSSDHHPTAVATGESSPTASPVTKTTTTGGVSKPVRRRTRASRRTPTTLLNTNTSNFRAMVQQFTGGPTGPHSTSPAAFAFAAIPRPSPATYQQHGYPYTLGGGAELGNDTFLQRLSSGRPVGPAAAEGFLMGASVPVRPASDSTTTDQSFRSNNNFMF